MRIRYWIPAFFWMGVIFLFSTELFSMPGTSPWVEGLLRWFFPTASDTTVQTFHLIVRKAAHVMEYAALSLFYFWGLSGSFRPTSWKGSIALASVVLSVLYAASDEWHQSFSPFRTGTPVDVGWDALGAVLAQTAVRLRLRN